MNKDRGEQRCAICEAYLHVLQGGRCVRCKERVCRTHLYLKKEGLVCLSCLREKGK